MTTAAEQKDQKEQKAPVNQRYWRQLDILPPERLADVHFTVVGAGAIGSWAVLTLAKMGAQHISVWDDDRVDEHNVSNQLYGPDEIGNAKVHALADWLYPLTGVNLANHDLRVEKGRALVFSPRTVLVAAVDNMETRKLLWEVAKTSPSVQLFVDPRMGGEVLRLYAVRPTDPQHQEFYEANLYGSKDAEQLPCTAQSIIYTAQFAGAFIASVAASFLRGGDYAKETVFDCRSFRIISSTEV